MGKKLTVLKISICLLELESTKGHLKWKVTELESKARISRSLIYEYLGSSKPEMLKEALSFFAAYFYGFTDEALKVPFSERISMARAVTLSYPEVSVFYHKWRSRDSWIQQELIKIENKFQRKLRKLYPHLDERKSRMVHGFLHGIVTAPFLTTEQTADAAVDLEELFLKKESFDR